jgi:hypothetical protein
MMHHVTPGKNRGDEREGKGYAKAFSTLVVVVME